MDALRDCWRLAWPLILSNLSVPLLGMVDAAVVGHLPGAHHLAGVALGAVVVGVLYFLCGFLRTGTTALAAQALGAGDALEERATLVRGLLVAGVAGALLIAARPLVAAAAEQLFAPGAGAREEMAAYIGYRLLGAPAALAWFVLIGWFIGAQDTRRPLVLMLLSNGLNAALDVLFVYGFGMAAAGVAVATVLAEYAGVALGLLAARRRWRELGGSPPRAAVLVAERFRRLLVVNRDLFLRSLFLEAVFLAQAALGSRLGEATVAANAVLMTLFTASAYGLDGFAHAVEALVGRAVGARSPGDLRAAVRAGFVLAGALALLMGVAFALAGPTLVGLLTSLPEVRALAGDLMPYAALLPVVAVWAFVYDGVFFGATRAAELRDGMLLALLVFALLAVPLVPAFGNHGLWQAFLGFLAARGVILAVAYRRAGGAAAFARG